MLSFFCTKYSALLRFTVAETDALQEEFTEYQLLERSEIPESVSVSVWKEAETVVKEAESGIVEYHRMDVIWGYLSEMKRADGSLVFEHLAKVAKLVLIVPHSNAGEERVFNLIKLNKTQTRSCLDSNGTLSSIIKVKLANRDSCINWDPPSTVMTSAKGATKRYNGMHKKKQ